MLYSLSILYKSKIPMCVVFNKTDIMDCKFAMEWMTDYDKFDEALSKQDNYLASLSRSMGLVLDEFYNLVPYTGVSATTGEGFDDLCTKFAGLK
jgi:translation initiation factor IF-2